MKWYCIVFMNMKSRFLQKKNIKTTENLGKRFNNWNSGFVETLMLFFTFFFVWQFWDEMKFEIFFLEKGPKSVFWCWRCKLCIRFVIGWYLDNIGVVFFGKVGGNFSVCLRSFKMLLYLKAFLMISFTQTSLKLEQKLLEILIIYLKM